VAADKLRIMLAGSLADERVAAFAPNLPDHLSHPEPLKAEDLRGSAIRQPSTPRLAISFLPLRAVPHPIRKAASNCEDRR